MPASGGSSRRRRRTNSATARRWAHWGPGRRARRSRLVAGKSSAATLLRALGRSSDGTGLRSALAQEAAAASASRSARRIAADDSGRWERVRARRGINRSNIAVEAPGWRGARRSHTRRHVTDEQRSQPGWVGREDERVISRRALTAGRRSRHPCRRRRRSRGRDGASDRTRGAAPPACAPRRRRTSRRCRRRTPSTRCWPGVAP